MKKLQNHLIGVDQGEIVLFSDFETDGPMWSGDGHRSLRREVEFSSAYRSAPMVQCWLSMVDISNTTNCRTDVQAEDISETGFAIVFQTWGDTKIARVRVAWQSIGEVPHDDDWDVV